jgi:selenocysteine lyase/cysteine desulfurase
LGEIGGEAAGEPRNPRRAFVIQRVGLVGGAMVILDVYQSAGILPIDVKELDVDVVIGGCLKWLCGGPGAAFLYVRPISGSGSSPG